MISNNFFDNFIRLDSNWSISQNENNFRKQYSSLSHVKNFLLLLKNFLLLVKKRQIDHKSHKFHEEMGWG